LQSANDENEILEEDEVTYDKFAQVALLVGCFACLLAALCKPSHLTLSL
jgi:hypothetical protein